MSFAGRLQKLASETAIYGLSSILGRMINFLLFPFYSHVFAPEAYGVVSIVYVALIFFNIVYQYGMEAAYLKHAADSAAAAERRRVFSTALWSLLGTSLALSALLVVLHVPAAALIGLEAHWAWLLYYAAGILVLDTLAVVPYAELRLQNRPWRFAAIRLANIGVNVGLNVLLIVGFGLGIEAVFLANLAASATTVLLLLPTYLGMLRPAFDGALWRQLLLFGLPFLPGGLGYAVADRVNLFYLKRMSPEQVLRLYGDDPSAGALDAAEGAYGSYVVGVFNGAVKLAVFMTLVVQMFRFAWQPFFLQHARDADARALFARVFTLFTAFGLFIFLGVSFFARELVALPLPGGRMLIDPSYWLGLFVVPVALLGYLFQGWYYNFAAGAYLEKQTKYFVPCTLAGATASVLLNAVLVPHYGMLGAAWATTVAYLLMALLLYLIVRRFYAVPYEWTRVAGMGSMAAALFLAWHYEPALQRWWIELLLLALFAGSLLALRVVPLASLRRLAARTHRPPPVADGANDE